MYTDCKTKFIKVEISLWFDGDNYCLKWFTTFFYIMQYINKCLFCYIIFILFHFYIHLTLLPLQTRKFLRYLGLCMIDLFHLPKQNTTAFSINYEITTQLLINNSNIN